MLLYGWFYIGVSRPLKQYLRMFKISALVRNYSRYEPAHNELSTNVLLLEVGQGGGWGLWP